MLKFDLYYVNKYPWSGESPMVTCSVMLMYALGKADIHSTVIAEGNPRNDSSKDLREHYGLEPKTDFHVKLFSRVIFNKIKCTPFFYASAIIYIIKNHRRNRKTIVISRNTTFLPWLFILKWFAGCIVLFDSHVYHGRITLPEFSNSHKRKMFSMNTQFRIIEQFFINSCNGLICQTALQRELYCKDFVRVPTTVLPLGSIVHSGAQTKDTKEFSFANRRIAYIGNYFDYVDATILFDAVSICKKESIGFLWIGLQKTEQARFLKEVCDRDIGELCDLRGWMPYPSMCELLQKEASAGIVLYKPSQHTSAMVSPTKIFDYFSAGLPVIGPRITSVTGYVRDGIEGALYDPGSAKSLARAMQTVLLDEKQYQKMKNNAITAAYSHSWGNRANQLSSFIKNVTQTKV